jgi:UDP-glucose 4-epimerase
VEQLVFASSSAIYGEVSIPTSEDFGPLIPISFYGAAKLASEAYCSAYAHRHDIKTWVFRFPNVVGSRATHGVVLDFILKLKNNPDELQVLGDGSQTKPYLYVHDLIDAMTLAWRSVNPEPFEVFNIAPETATRVSDIAEMVVKKMQPGARIVYGTEPIGWPGDVPTFAYDMSKIRSLGWKPSGSSDAAVAQAVMDVIAEQADR